MKMNKYFAFEREIDGVPTFGLMPISTSASMQTGYYNTTTSELVLVSKDTYPDFKFIERLDEFGQVVKSKNGKVNVTRIPTNENITFRLDAISYPVFVETYVENKEVVYNVLKKLEKFLEDKAAASAEKPTK